MFKQKIFIASFIVLTLVAILNYMGGRFYWYWIYGWFDIPMHILGGVWVSLTFLSLCSYFFDKILVVNSRIKLLIFVLLVVLFVGIFWEIFELLGGITSLNDGIDYWLDTFKDIIDDLIGGFIVYLFFVKKSEDKTCLVYNNIQK